MPFFIFVLGSTTGRKYVVQTYSDDIKYEILYVLDLRCYDNGTLGLTNYDTNLNTVVRFVSRDVFTTTEESPIPSSVDFSTKPFKASASRHENATNKATTFSRSAFSLTYLESTTAPTTVSSPKLTSPVESKLIIFVPFICVPLPSYGIYWHAKPKS